MNSDHQEGAWVSVIVALLLITTYAVSFAWLFWVMTPWIFWIFVFWLTGYKP